MYVFSFFAITLSAHEYNFKQKTNNVSHPALKHLSIEFFYKHKDSLARHFPDHYKNSVPEGCLILASTAVRLLVVSTF